MAPRPQFMSMNQHRHEDITRTRTTRGGTSESENLAATAAAAKPKDESLYESLLRFQEEQDPGDSMSSLPKLSWDNNDDEEDDRKLPAKPTPVRQRSRSLMDSHMTLSARRRFEAMLNDQGDEYESPAWQQDDSFAEHSLYPTLLHPSHREGHHLYSTSSSRDELVQRHEQAHLGSVFPESSPPPPATLSRAASHTHSSPHRKSSFYTSALEAYKNEKHSALFATDLAEDEKLARELARELDEKLAAQELAKKIEAEDEKLARELDERLAQEMARKMELEDAAVPDFVAEDADPGQLLILQAIREERARKELEKALQDSEPPGLRSDSGFYTAPDAPPGTTTIPPQAADYLLSQQLAMQECQKKSKLPTPRNRSPIPPTAVREQQHYHYRPHIQPVRRHHSTGEHERAHRVSFEHYTPHSSDEAEPRINPVEDRLLQQGNMETREAIANGRAHVVKCRGCEGRLHAPMSYALVFCPKCHTVSPGETFVAQDDRASLRRGRSKRL